jgi:hypothetical protein
MTVFSKTRKMGFIEMMTWKKLEGSVLTPNNAIKLLNWFVNLFESVESFVGLAPGFNTKEQDSAPQNNI